MIAEYRCRKVLSRPYASARSATREPTPQTTAIKRPPIRRAVVASEVEDGVDEAEDAEAEPPDVEAEEGL
jgi:hypothetical protein